MATKEEYDAGAIAALHVAQLDFLREVPQIFQHKVPQDLVRQAATEMAKAAIDAAEHVRSQK